MNAYADHYARFDQLVRCAASLGDAIEVLGRDQQRDVLDFLLPGVGDVFACWDELAEPLERLEQVNYRTAVDEMRERGARGPIDPGSADALIRDEIKGDIRDVIRAHRRPTAGQVALVAVGQ